MSIEQSIEIILYRNASGTIAEELFDLLIQATRPGFDLDKALTLLYSELDHYEAGQAQYIAERKEALGLGQ